MFERKRLLMGSISFAFVLLTCPILKSQTPGPSRKALTNQDVIELVKAGLSSEVVTARIRWAGVGCRMLRFLNRGLLT